jgi:hypothetical protein
MATESYANEGDLHAVLGRALIDTAFRERLLDETQQQEALEEMGIAPSREVVDALNKAIGALIDLSSTFGAKRAAT